MKTRIILISGLGLALAGVVALSGGDSEGGAEAGGDGSVVAGFYPLAFAAEQVGGQGLEVENLTPPGAEPHDIEISPREVERLQAASLVLLMGRDFQPQLEEAAKEADGEVLEVLDAPGVRLLGDEGDPHVWLDPVRFATVVERVAEVLGDQTAAAPLVERLERLDRVFRATLAECRRTEIVTSHEAFGYLADRYGLRQIAITGLSPEAEPSPAELTDAVRRVRSTGATTVFSETLLSAKLAETVARESGAETAVLNPIEGLTEGEHDRGEDYFSLMRRNLSELRAGLGCR